MGRKRPNTATFILNDGADGGRTRKRNEIIVQYYQTVIFHYLTLCHDLNHLLYTRSNCNPETKPYAGETVEKSHGYGS